MIINRQITFNQSIVDRDRFIARVRNAIKDGGKFTFKTISDKCNQVLGFRFSKVKFEAMHIFFTGRFAETT